MLKKFVLGGMVVVAALLGNACGDDGSSDSPAGPALVNFYRAVDARGWPLDN